MAHCIIVSRCGLFYKSFVVLPSFFCLLLGVGAAHAGVWQSLEMGCEGLLARLHGQPSTNSKWEKTFAEVNYAKVNIEILFSDLLPLSQRNFLKEAFALHINSPFKKGDELAQALVYPDAEEYLGSLIPGMRQRAAQVLAENSGDLENQPYVEFHVSGLESWAKKSESLIRRGQISYYEFMHHIYDYAGLVSWSYSRDFLEIQDLEVIQERYFVSSPLSEFILSGKSLFENFPYIAFLPTTQSFDFEDVTNYVGLGPWPLGLAPAHQSLTFDGDSGLDAGTFFFHDIFHFSVAKATAPSGRAQRFENLRLEKQLRIHFERARLWRKFHRDYSAWARVQPDSEWLQFASFALIREFGQSPSKWVLQLKERRQVAPGGKLVESVSAKFRQDLVQNLVVDQNLGFDHEGEIPPRVDAAIEGFFNWLLDYAEQAELP